MNRLLLEDVDELAWVPEDIFFLWTLMVRGEVALTRHKTRLPKKLEWMNGRESKIEDRGSGIGDR